MIGGCDFSPACYKEIESVSSRGMDCVNNREVMDSVAGENVIRAVAKPQGRICREWKAGCKTGRRHRRFRSSLRLRGV